MAKTKKEDNPLLIINSLLAQGNGHKAWELSQEIDVQTGLPTDDFYTKLNEKDEPQSKTTGLEDSLDGD